MNSREMKRASWIVRDITPDPESEPLHFENVSLAVKQKGKTNNQQFHK